MVIALTNLLHAAGRLRDSCLQQRIQVADSIDAGGADVAVQVLRTEPVLEQKEGPVRGAASSKQGDLQQCSGSQKLTAAGEASLYNQKGCQRREQRMLCPETASRA